MALNVAAEYKKGNLSEFIRLAHGDILSAGQIKREIDRAALALALRNYHISLGTLDKKLKDQLTLLENPDSHVVVTGQQAGLLTGPAYSIHKAVDAILLARKLSTPEKPVLPIYWLASQDHDSAEVASTTLLDMNEKLHTLRLDLPEGVPVGRIEWQDKWTEQILAMLEGFEAPEAHKTRVAASIKGAMQPNSTYAQVFARLLSALLGQSGLIVLDPMYPDIANLAVKHIKAELNNPLESSRLIEEAAYKLEKLGFKPQLRRPKGATNLFIEEADGQRRLLRYDSVGIFSTATRKYSLEELYDALENPSCITPAAGLRPVIQDLILPTMAFVVGPGEIAYAAQMREVYGLHGIRQPLLWPRLSVTWLEPNVSRLLARLGSSVLEVQASPAVALGRALAKERRSGALSLGMLDALSEQLSSLTKEIGKLDPTLVKASQRTHGRTMAHIERLQKLSAYALARQENDRSGQLDRLKKHLLPNGIPQEREMNFFSFLLKHGSYPLELLLKQEAGFTGDLEII